MEQRYYDPAIGRFISPDPIGYDGGLNLYSYAFNDPVNGIDPTGLDTWVTPLQRRADSLAGWARGVAGAIQGGIDRLFPYGRPPEVAVAGLVVNAAGEGAAFPSHVTHLGEGAGTFAGNPTWGNVPGLVRDIGTAATFLGGVGELGGLGAAAAEGAGVCEGVAGKLPSLIKNYPGLVREAEAAGRSQATQEGLDALQRQLAMGNANPGKGTRHLFGGVYEARSNMGGARLYFRNRNGTFEILAKSGKKNQGTVIGILRRLFGR